jgi:hypothetical protein
MRLKDMSADLFRLGFTVRVPPPFRCQVFDGNAVHGGHSIMVEQM